MESLVSPIDDHRHLELRFQRVGDRHCHAVFLIDGERSQCIMRTKEGDDTAFWPPSPPLQQLSMESREDGNVALLVGMAGRSHWSLSVEAEEKGGFHFDAACRLAADTDESRWLGSTYEFLEPHILELVPIEGLLVSAETDTFQAVPRSSGDRQLRWTYAIRMPAS